MRFLKLLVFLSATVLLAGCANVKGLKLLAPEPFGLRALAPDVYIESSADEQAVLDLHSALFRAREAVHVAYGGVASHPIVHACVTEDCYARFGGQGSRAKVYGDYILLSPRGLSWHFLAHEWSHAELRTRLNFRAWWALPVWFDEGLAVAVSEAPEHSEAHWQFLVANDIPRPSREALLACTTGRQWLDAVRRYGERPNAERRARGEPEIRPVYAAAGHELRLWLSRVGDAGLRSLIERLNDGESFERVYPGLYESRGPGVARAPGRVEGME
ncbi:MAG: hypothetical protein AB1766_06580 [Pseudomonadota bacterium]